MKGKLSYRKLNYIEFILILIVLIAGITRNFYRDGSRQNLKLNIIFYVSVVFIIIVDFVISRFKKKSTEILEDELTEVYLAKSNKFTVNVLLYTLLITIPVLPSVSKIQLNYDIAFICYLYIIALKEGSYLYFERKDK